MSGGVKRMPHYLCLFLEKSFEKDLATWRYFVAVGFKPKDIKCEHGIVESWQNNRRWRNFVAENSLFLGCIDWLLPNLHYSWILPRFGRMENGKLAQYQQRDELSLMLSRIEQLNSNLNDYSKDTDGVLVALMRLGLVLYHCFNDNHNHSRSISVQVAYMQLWIWNTIK